MAPSADDMIAMMRQAKNFSWKSQPRSLPTVAEGPVELISTVYDVAAPFGGYSQLASQVDAVNILADEFAVSVHWNLPDAGAVPNPQLATGLFIVETLDPDSSSNSASRFNALSVAEDIAPAMNAGGMPAIVGTPANLGGFSTIIVPTARIIRFRVRLETLTFVPDFRITMQVTARLRSPHLLWEQQGLLRSIEKSEREKVQIDRELLMMYRQGTVLQPAGLRR